MMKELAPEILCGALVGSKGLKYAGFYCERFGFEFYHPDFMTLTEEDVRECKEHGVGINAWTVNDLGGLEQMAEWDCEGVITNYPDAAMKYKRALKLLAKGPGQSACTLECDNKKGRLL